MHINTPESIQFTTLAIDYYNKAWNKGVIARTLLYCDANYGDWCSVMLCGVCVVYLCVMCLCDVSL